MDKRNKSKKPIERDDETFPSVSSTSQPVESGPAFVPVTDIQGKLGADYADPEFAMLEYINVDPISALVAFFRLYGVSTTILDPVVASIISLQKTPNRDVGKFKALLTMANNWNGNTNGVVSYDLNVIARHQKESRVPKEDLAYLKSPIEKFVGKGRNGVVFNQSRRTVTTLGERNDTFEYAYHGDVQQADRTGLGTLGLVWSLPTVWAKEYVLRYIYSARTNANADQVTVAANVKRLDPTLGLMMDECRKMRDALVQATRTDDKTIIGQEAVSKYLDLTLTGMRYLTGYSAHLEKVVVRFGNKDLGLVPALTQMRIDYFGGKGPVKRPETLFELADLLKVGRAKCEDGTKMNPLGGPNFGTVLTKQAMLGVVMEKFAQLKPDLTFDEIELPPLYVQDSKDRAPTTLFFGAGEANVTYMKQLSAHYFDINVSAGPSYIKDFFEMELLPDDVVMSDIKLTSTQYLNRFKETKYSVPRNKAVGGNKRVSDFETTYCVVRHLVDRGVKKFGVKVLLGHMVEENFIEISELHRNYAVVWFMGGRHHNGEIYMVCTALAQPRNPPVSPSNVEVIVGRYMSVAISVSIARLTAELTFKEVKTEYPDIALPGSYVGTKFERLALAMKDLFPKIILSGKTDVVKYITASRTGAEYLPETVEAIDLELSDDSDGSDADDEVPPSSSGDADK